MNLKKGFTLIELLVVISIISLLSSIIISSVNSARDKAVATASNTIAQQYAQVIQQYYFDNNGYPNPGVGTFCLGNYPSPCGTPSEPIPGNSDVLLNMIRPYYPGLPRVANQGSNKGPSYAYCGASCFPPFYVAIMFWPVPDTSLNCGFGGYGAVVSGVTLCYVYFQADGNYFGF